MRTYNLYFESSFNGKIKLIKVLNITQVKINLSFNQMCYTVNLLIYFISPCCLI